MLKRHLVIAASIGTTALIGPWAGSAHAQAPGAAPFAALSPANGALVPYSGGQRVFSWLHPGYISDFMTLYAAGDPEPVATLNPEGDADRPPGVPEAADAATLKVVLRPGAYAWTVTGTGGPSETTASSRLFTFRVVPPQLRTVGVTVRRTRGTSTKRPTEVSFSVRSTSFVKTSVAVQRSGKTITGRTLDLTDTDDDSTSQRLAFDLGCRPLKYTYRVTVSNALGQQLVKRGSFRSLQCRRKSSGGGSGGSGSGGSGGGGGSCGTFLGVRITVDGTSCETARNVYARFKSFEPLPAGWSCSQAQRTCTTQQRSGGGEIIGDPVKTFTWR